MERTMKHDTAFFAGDFASVLATLNREVGLSGTSELAAEIPLKLEEPAFLQLTNFCDDPIAETNCASLVVIFNAKMEPVFHMAL